MPIAEPPAVPPGKGPSPDDAPPQCERCGSVVVGKGARSGVVCAKCRRGLAVIDREISDARGDNPM